MTDRPLFIVAESGERTLVGTCTVIVLDDLSVGEIRLLAALSIDNREAVVRAYEASQPITLATSTQYGEDVVTGRFRKLLITRDTAQTYHVGIEMDEASLTVYPLAQKGT